MSIRFIRLLAVVYAAGVLTTGCGQSSTRNPHLSNNAQDAAGVPADFVADWQCSQWSAMRISPFLGVNLDRNAIETHLSSRQKSHSLQDLRTTFDQLGFTCRGRYLKWSEFAERGKLPAIVHLHSPDHFVVAVRSTSGKVVWIDGTETGSYLVESHVQARWSGFFLEIHNDVSGDKSASRPDGPSASYDSLQLDAGKLESLKESLEFVYTVRNRGNQPLVVLKVDSDCSCLTAEAGSEPVQPGSSAEIRLKYSIGKDSRSGMLRRTATVTTNDPARPIVELVATGFVDHLLRAYPMVLDLGEVPVGREVVRHVTILQRSMPEDFRITSITSGSSKIQCRMGSTSDIAPWNAELIPLSKPLDSQVIEIQYLDVTPCDRPQPLQTEVTLATNHALWPKLSVPVRAIAVPPISSDSDFAVFRQREDGVLETQVRLRNHFLRDIQSVKAKLYGSFINCSIIGPNGMDQLVIRLETKNPKVRSENESDTELSVELSSENAPAVMVHMHAILSKYSN